MNIAQNVERAARLFPDKSAIVLKEGETATAEEIDDYCRKHLAVYKVPSEFEFLEELPKSPTGKILKRILREKA